MISKLSHDAPDSEFSIADEYRMPILAVRGIAHEVVITKLSDFDAISKSVKDVAAIRAEIENALFNMENIRLVPVR